MEDAHRQQLQDAIKDPRHPYSYDNFLATIDAIVHHWEPNTEYEPGWTPLQWANDLKSKFTREVWEHQDLRLYTQQNIIVFLQNPSLVPNIYSKDFPSFERLRWCGTRAIKGLENGRDNSWLRKLTYEQLSILQDERTAELHENSHNLGAVSTLLSETLQSLEGRRSGEIYKKWYTSIHTVVEEFCDTSTGWTKMPDIVGALEACCEMIDRAGEVVDKVLRSILPVPHQFALLCGLISGDSASNTAHQHDPRFAPQDRRLPQTSGFAQHHRLRSESAFDSARALEYLDSRIIMLLARYSEKYARDQGNYSRAQQRLEQLRNKATHVRAQEAVHLVGEYMAAVYRRGWEYLPEANMIVR